MQDAEAIQRIETRYAALSLSMDERMRRQWAAAEAKSYGWGGRCAVSRATGISPNTISKGLDELAARPTNPVARESLPLRKPGGGRKRATVADPDLALALERLVDPVNQGWVSVGIDHDTARFAAEAIYRWWKKMGSKRYPRARELLITADGGGSNASRSRLWKVALQELAQRLRMPIHVCHFPPGTSKWNKIEHRMFCHITQNWRGRPLVSHEVIVNLIAHTTTTQGLKIKAQLDTGVYPTGLKVSNQQLATVNLHPALFHGEWNYSILPAERKN